MTYPLPSLVGSHVIDKMCEVMQSTPLEGCIVEVGVYMGGSLQKLLEKSQGRPVFGYDTFTGIPFQDQGDSHKVGDFNDTNVDFVRANLPGATIVQGIFPASAVDMPPVSFAHIDCDQYRSIKDCIDYLRPRMLKGGVMWFDDYNCLDSANRAVDEAFGSEVQITVCGKAMVVF
jgi:hypothetical protein